MLHLVRSTARRCGKRDLACSGRAFVNLSNLKRPPQEVEVTRKHIGRAKHSDTRLLLSHIEF